jgi:hypothetical protein
MTGPCRVQERTGPPKRAPPLHMIKLTETREITPYCRCAGVIFRGRCSWPRPMRVWGRDGFTALQAATLSCGFISWAASGYFST